MTFTDRVHAGQLLAAELVSCRDRTDVAVLALPRGGVIVGCEVATHLQIPLDVLVVRKLGLPGFSEMAIGAIAPDDVRVVSQDTLVHFQLSPEDVREVIEAEQEELRRRTHQFRQDRPYPVLHDKTVILVDDGLATGHTMRAAITWTRSRGSREIVVAVPVGAPDICEDLSRTVDRLVCLSQPRDFCAVGEAYLNFQEVTDHEVIEALKRTEEDLSFSPSSEINQSHEAENGIPLVKTAKIKLSSPQSAELGLTDGRILRVAGEAAREPINAIAAAKDSSHYHSTFGIPIEGGGVAVVAVDGSHLDVAFRN